MKKESEIRQRLQGLPDHNWRTPQEALEWVLEEPDFVEIPTTFLKAAIANLEMGCRSPLLALELKRYIRGAR